MSAKESKISARERIENLWSRGFAVGPYLDAYRDEVAHELAEKIRAAAYEVNYGDAGAEARDAYANEFADLIDPEVRDD